MTMYDVKTMQTLCRMSGLSDLVLSHNQSGGEPLKLPVALYLFYMFFFNFSWNGFEYADEDM